MVQIEALEQQGPFDDARKMGLAILRSLGEHYSRKSNMFHVVRGLLQTQRLLEKYTHKQLLNMPAMTDKNEIRINEIRHMLMRILFFVKTRTCLFLCGSEGYRRLALLECLPMHVQLLHVLELCMGI